jgi:hypothetical protein
MRKNIILTSTNSRKIVLVLTFLVVCFTLMSLSHHSYESIPIPKTSSENDTIIQDCTGTCTDDKAIARYTAALSREPPPGDMHEPLAVRRCRSLIFVQGY